MSEKYFVNIIEGEDEEDENDVDCSNTIKESIPLNSSELIKGIFIPEKTTLIN